jgi:hypothetical protein
MVVTFLESIGYQHHHAWELIEGPDKDRPIPGLDFSPRYLMQTIGTRWGRDTIAQDLWVRIALGKVRATHLAGRGVVIDDVRYPNEYGAIMLADGEVWRVVNPWAEEVAKDHPSEGQLDDRFFDRAIVNDGSKEDLYRKVRDALGASMIYPLPYAQSAPL